MKRILTVSLMSAFVVTLLSCATSSNRDLDSARFALDNADWNGAISAAGAALNDNPANTEAALLLSSGYAGRAGIRLLPLASDLSDTNNSDEQFGVIQSALAGVLTSFGDLRSAITELSDTLTPQPTSIDTDPLYRDQQFQLGLLQAIEAYTLPSLSAQPTESGTVAVANIQEDVRAATQSDLQTADDHLINSGMSASDDLIVNIRKTYCALRTASGTASGISVEALRDMNLCQLTAENARSGLSTFESATIATCGDFDFTSTTCTD